MYLSISSGCHTQTTVADGDGTVFLVHFYTYRQIAQFTFKIAHGGQCLQFLELHPPHWKPVHGGKFHGRYTRTWMMGICFLLNRYYLLHISLFFMIVRINFSSPYKKKCQIRLYLTFCLYTEILSEFRYVFLLSFYSVTLGVHVTCKVSPVCGSSLIISSASPSSRWFGWSVSTGGHRTVRRSLFLPYETLWPLVEQEMVATTFDTLVESPARCR